MGRVIACDIRPLESLGYPSSSDHIAFSGDFRPCLADDDDEDCDVISGSGEVDARQSTDLGGDSSTAGNHRFIYVERTSPLPEVTSDDRGHVTTSAESLVVVVEMTERSTPLRHAGRPVYPTLPPSTVGRPPPYRLLTTTSASVGVAAVGDGRGPAVAERVVINVGLIVGIVGAVSTLVVMLAALLLCRPRPHVAQSSPGVDDRKFKLSSTSNGDQVLRHTRNNIVVHAGLQHSPAAQYQSAAVACTAGSRVSTADEWFV